MKRTIMSYKLFEGYLGDLIAKLNTVNDREGIDLIKNTKLDIDQYLYNLTDYYQDDERKSYINYVSLETFYFFKIEIDEIDDFLEELKESTYRIEKHFELSCYIKDIFALVSKNYTKVISIKRDIKVDDNIKTDIFNTSKYWADDVHGYKIILEIKLFR